MADIFALFLIIIFLIYCFSGDLIRKKYKKEGVKLEGYIDSAKESFNGRGENRYRLKIAFYDNYDNVKKTRITEWYVGNPNKKLKSRKCSVYKLNGKYIETDFDVRGKKESVYSLNILIDKSQM